MNKQTVFFLILLLVALMQCGIAQNAYQIPFASAGNTIELTVANTAEVPLSSVKVEASDLPSWMKFAATEQRIALLKPQQEGTVAFTFAVDKLAPVQKSQTLKFLVTGSGGQQWVKEIVVAIAPPEKFELFQNFPNPFNPTTAISFQLSAISEVSLKIFNLLGQEVASLVDADRLPGYHQETWDATRYSSGMYVYQLIATDDRGQKQIARKRMMLLK